MAFEEEDEENNKSNRSSWFRSPGFLIILLGAFMLILSIFTNIWGTGEIKRTTMAGTHLILIGISAWAIEGEIKNRSPKFLCQNYHTTVNLYKGTFTVGNWFLARAGGMSWNIFQTAGNDGTIIVPHSATKPIGQGTGYASLTYIMPVRLNELPLNVQEEIIKSKLPAPYLWGIASYQQILNAGREIETPKEVGKMKSPDISQLWLETRKLNQQLSEVRDLLHKGAFGAVEDIIARGSRIQSKASRGNLGDRIKKTLWNSDKQE